jgi:predicted ATPase
MLTKLRIQNFKAWRDTGELRLAPITVFFGTNSSGKTSLLQLLLMLKQTAESPDRRRVLHFGDSKTLVELGTFHDVVSNHDESLPIAFELDWELEEPIEIPRVSEQEGDPLRGARVHFQAEIKGPEPLSVKEIAYTLFAEDGFTFAMRPTETSGGKYELHAEGYELTRNVGRVWQLPPPSRFYGFPDEAVAYYKNTSFVADLALGTEKLLAAIHYVGPLREYPQRAYVWSGEIPEDVGHRGERAVEAVLAARDRKLNRGPHQRKEVFEHVVARWLRTMGLIDTFEVRPLAQHRKEHEVLVKTSGSKSLVNLTDVGFGLSQVLPVIVQCFYAPRGSILIFEQPEIHLHPRVQAALADLFIEAICAREGAKERRIQILVESHSEHFLRRLQRRVAEEKLKKEEAALYFCEAGREGSRIRELEVDDYGRISNWPEHFFGDVTGELEEQTKRMLERQQTLKDA